jgi:hypothetical protein
MKLVACGAVLMAALAGAPRLARGAPYDGVPRTTQISALQGKAQRTRSSGARSDLRVGAAVAQGDTIETQEGARLEIRFSDGSVLRLGPGSKLQLAEAHFRGGPARRKLNARLFFGKLWAKVTSVIQGEQRFQVETENAVAGVRGTTFRVDANADQSVLVRVYDGTVAVAKNVASEAKPGEGRREVQGPQEVTRDQWEKLVGRQMQIFVSADGTPGQPEPFSSEADQDDPFARWNQQRDAAAK